MAIAQKLGANQWSMLTPKQRAQFITYARRALTVVADAGLLVSPQILAVLEAAKRADKLHQTATFTTPFEDFEAVADDLHAAVDALEEANRQ
jgi:hypothetical protein